MRDVYLTSSSTYLPGPAVANDKIEDHIGQIDAQSQRFGRLILKQNKIKTRHYVPRENGVYQTNNAQMAAKAALGAIETTKQPAHVLSHLATGTTQGDLLVPGHGSTVHGELSKLTEIGPLEIASFQSVCASSIMAVRSASQHIASGEGELAIATGSEFSSRWFQPAFYDCAQDYLSDREHRMSVEFLRYTLSDGAGAMAFSATPNADFPSYKLEWIKLISLAHSFDACMYAGARSDTRYDLTQSWSQYTRGPIAAAKDGAIMLAQDMALLKRIIRAWVGEYLKLVDSGLITPAKIDHLLCHYSAHSLREEIIRIMKSTGGMIDEEKWFTNLYTCGNTGSAAPFIMLDEFSRKNIAKSGESVLCIVPESGRAMVGFMMLTRI